MTGSDHGAGMPCPRCRVDLVMSDRQGIEVDYCPKCRGVWLDRGELDKIIERNAQFSASADPAPTPPPSAWVTPPPHAAPPPGYQQVPPPGYPNQAHGGYRGRRDDDDDDRRRPAYDGKRRKGGWLAELFD